MMCRYVDWIQDPNSECMTSKVMGRRCSSLSIATWIAVMWAFGFFKSLCTCHPYGSTPYLEMFYSCDLFIQSLVRIRGCNGFTLRINLDLCLLSTHILHLGVYQYFKYILGRYRAFPLLSTCFALCYQCTKLCIIFIYCYRPEQHNRHLGRMYCSLDHL